jgi:hypothetical protein
MVGVGLGGDIGSNRQQVVCAVVAYWLEGQWGSKMESVGVK